MAASGQELLTFATRPVSRILTDCPQVCAVQWLVGADASPGAQAQQREGGSPASVDPGPPACLGAEHPQICAHSLGELGPRKHTRCRPGRATCPIRKLARPLGLRHLHGSRGPLRAGLGPWTQGWEEAGRHLGRLCPEASEPHESHPLPGGKRETNPLFSLPDRTTDWASAHSTTGGPSSQQPRVSCLDRPQFRCLGPTAVPEVCDVKGPAHG